MCIRDSRSTVNRWVIKFCGCEPGKAVIDDEKRSGRPITATDDKHRKLIDDLIPVSYTHLDVYKRQTITISTTTTSL